MACPIDKTGRTLGTIVSTGPVAVTLSSTIDSTSDFRFATSSITTLIKVRRGDPLTLSYGNIQITRPIHPGNIISNFEGCIWTNYGGYETVSVSLNGDNSLSLRAGSHTFPFNTYVVPVSDFQVRFEFTFSINGGGRYNYLYPSSGSWGNSSSNASFGKVGFEPNLPPPLTSITLNGLPAWPVKDPNVKYFPGTNTVSWTRGSDPEGDALYGWQVQARSSSSSSSILAACRSVQGNTPKDCLRNLTTNDDKDTLNTELFFDQSTYDSLSTSSNTLLVLMYDTLFTPGECCAQQVSSIPKKPLPAISNIQARVAGSSDSFASLTSSGSSGTIINSANIEFKFILNTTVNPDANLYTYHFEDVNGVSLTSEFSFGATGPEVTEVVNLFAIGLQQGVDYRIRVRAGENLVVGLYRTGVFESRVPRPTIDLFNINGEVVYNVISPVCPTQNSINCVKEIPISTGEAFGIACVVHCDPAVQVESFDIDLQGIRDSTGTLGNFTTSTVTLDPPLNDGDEFIYIYPNDNSIDPISGRTTVKYRSGTGDLCRVVITIRDTFTTSSGAQTGRFIMTGGAYQVGVFANGQIGEITQEISHTAVLIASVKDSNGDLQFLSSVFQSGDATVEWFRNNESIKSGDATDIDSFTLNIDGDELGPWDKGRDIYFIITETETSSETESASISLANFLPTPSGTSFFVTNSGINTPFQATLSGFNDLDANEMLCYEIRIKQNGSTVATSGRRNGSNNDSITLPVSAVPGLGVGNIYEFDLFMSDGQRFDSNGPSANDQDTEGPLYLVGQSSPISGLSGSSSTAFTNGKIAVQRGGPIHIISFGAPTITASTINGTGCSGSPIIVQEPAPVNISWTPSTASGMTIVSYRIIIYLNSNFTNMFWDSGTVNSSSNSRTYDGPTPFPTNSNIYVRIAVTDSNGKSSTPFDCIFKYKSIISSYVIETIPDGNSNHTSLFRAALNDGSAIQPGFNIRWFQDSTLILSGNTSDALATTIGGFNATDGGTILRYEVDDPELGTTSSNTITILNNRINNISQTNLIFSPSVIIGGQKRYTSTGIQAAWTFPDPDGDKMFGFRLKLYRNGQESTPLFDTGYIYTDRPGDADGNLIVNSADRTILQNLQGVVSGNPSYNIALDYNRDGIIDSKELVIYDLFAGRNFTGTNPGDFGLNIPVALPQGQTINYKFEITDGEKVSPTSPDIPEPARVYVTGTGLLPINTKPIVSNLRVNNIDVGPGCTTTKSNPVISWNYFDTDGDPQVSYNLQVGFDPSFSTPGSLVWNASATNTATAVAYGGTALIDDAIYYIRIVSSDGTEGSLPVVGSFRKISETYILFPNAALHTTQMEARAASNVMAPFIDGGHQIQWFVNNILRKTGNTSNTADNRINSKNLGDVNFGASDTGSVVFFRIDNSINSNSLVIQNNPIQIAGAFAGPVVPGVNPRISLQPTINWQIEDLDNDPQFFFRLTLGTTQGGSETYDSGKIFYKHPGDAIGDLIVDEVDRNYVLSLSGSSFGDSNYDELADMNRDGIIDALDVSIVDLFFGKSYVENPTNYSLALPVELSSGTTYYCSIKVGDGEKVNILDPDIPDPSRVFDEFSFSFITNSKPEVRNVRVEGLPSGSQITTTKRPNFTWDYFDADGHAETAWNLKVYSDEGLTDLIWQSGRIVGNQNNVRYNFNSLGPDLVYFVNYYFTIEVEDTASISDPFEGNFLLFKAGPIIDICTVSDRINPLNLRTKFPVFEWDVDDDDSADVVSFEIRVSDQNEDVGADSFIGSIWNTGVVVSENPFRATWNFDGNCFAGCTPDKDLVPNTTYYYQVRVYDRFGQPSNWCSGFFRLNNPPSAVGLQVLPLVPFNNDDLEAFYVFVDDLGEKESDLTEIRWFRTRRGVQTEITSARDSKSISKDLTLNGDTWYFTVKPHDGTEYGELVRSPIVKIVNRAPSVTALPIQPSEPNASSELIATWLTSDPDGDEVTVSIEWYKNGIGQADLRNSSTVPSGYLKSGDTWYFIVQPFDGSDYGLFSKSDEVTIKNTKPEILSMTVDGDILPTIVENLSPIFAWRYSDIDKDVQSAYRVLVGTKSVKTNKNNAYGPPPFGSKDNGIVFIVPDGDVIEGDEVYDSGEKSGDDSSFQYISSDLLKPTILNSSDASRFFNYIIDQDFTSMILSPGRTNGEVSFDFSGTTGVYDIGLEFFQETKRSKFKISVDGIGIDEFTTESNNPGLKFKKLLPTRLNSGSKITVTGIAIDASSRARFKRLLFVPSKKFEILPSSMELSGFVTKANGSIALSALAGTATLAFPFPDGNYDIEFEYTTEITGNPTVSVDVGSERMLNFVYESGIQERSRFLQNVNIETGTILKITASKNGNATAIINKILFRPRTQTASSATLKEGLPYYVSVKVYDGKTWSDWYVTKFFLKGSSWGKNVSNAVGWTVEARFKVLETEQVNQQ